MHRFKVLEENKRIFKETQDYINSYYETETKNLVANTSVYFDGSIHLHDKGVSQKIEVIKLNSIDPGIKMAKLGFKTAILNFADPITPGGMVLDGETTQEESLCRCSNLYDSLNANFCMNDYYNYNRTFISDSDRLIYSPDALIVRDSGYNYLEEPVKVDFISAPAPVVLVATEQMFIQRIKCIIGAAVHEGVECLILGAWGTGAFGNDPEMVAEAFKKVIQEYHVIPEIVFAVPGEKFKVFEGVLLS